MQLLLSPKKKSPSFVSVKLGNNSVSWKVAGILFRVLYLFLAFLFRTVFLRKLGRDRNYIFCRVVFGMLSAVSWLYFLREEEKPSLDS